jgi:lysophospholipase L1-like esterase
MSTNKNKSMNKLITVACFGASITAAVGSFKWIDELEKRPQNKRFRFVNLGVGGDPAYAGLKRLPQVVATHPDVVIVAFGWNDIVTLLFKNARRFIGGWKGVSHEPTPEWFRENLQTIVRELQEQTSAKIALSSLSEMGEDPDSTDPVQRELNKRFKQYSKIIKEIAEEEKVYYIPLYERMHEQIVASPGRAFTAFRFRTMYHDAFRQYIQRQSLDKIAKINRWQFHVDGLHLNSRGGMILANLVQEFLDEQQ